MNAWLFGCEDRFDSVGAEWSVGGCEALNLPVDDCCIGAPVYPPTETFFDALGTYLSR